MTIALDAYISGQVSNAATKTVTISTNGTNRIVVVVVSWEGHINNRSVNSVAASGLSFSKRAGVAFDAQPNQECEIWWALAENQLSSLDVTVTFNANIDDMTVVVAAFSGVDTTSPWDTNASLPATYYNNSTSTPAGSMSTNHANTCLLFAAASPGNATFTFTSPTDSNLIAAVNNNGGTLYEHSSLSYKIVSSPQSSLSVGYNSAPAWTLVLDALREATGGNPHYAYAQQ